MTDTAALRARRYRHHQQGDHSLCVPGRCEHVAAAPEAVTPVTEAAAARSVTPPAAAGAVTAALDDDREPGGIEKAVRAYAASLSYTDADPRAALALIALKLAEQTDVDGAVPAVVRELRVLLVQLAEVPNGRAGGVDELRLRRARRRLNTLLSGA